MGAMLEAAITKNEQDEDVCTTSIRPTQDDIAEIEIEINRIKEQQNRE